VYSTHVSSAVKNTGYANGSFLYLAICRPIGCTVASGVIGVVVVVVVGVCNRSQMRISKCTCLILGISIDLDPG